MKYRLDQKLRSQNRKISQKRFFPKRRWSEINDLSRREIVLLKWICVKCYSDLWVLFWKKVFSGSGIVLSDFELRLQISRLQSLKPIFFEWKINFLHFKSSDLIRLIRKLISNWPAYAPKSEPQSELLLGRRTIYTGRKQLDNSNLHYRNTPEKLTARLGDLPGR